MLKGSAIWVLGAAGVACLAIGVGVFTNHRDDMSSLTEHVVGADVDPSREGWSEPRIVAAGTSDAAPAVATSEPVEDAVSTSRTSETSDEDAESTRDAEVVSDTIDASSEVDEAGAEPTTDVDPMWSARAAFAERDYAQVVATLEKVAADETRFDVHYLLGLALRYEGRHEESVAAMDAALAIQPQSVRALTNSARALLETRDLAQAEERARLAIELAPEDTGAWNVLGRVHLTRGALAEAEDAFARVLEIDPMHAWALNNLGFARLQRGAWQEAADVLERAVASRADVALFHNNLGIAYERLERLSDAQRAYAEALTLQAGYEKAEMSLARVTERIAEGATNLAVGRDTATVASKAPRTSDEDESSVQP